MKEAISKALGHLLGLPLWSAGRAGFVWFQFGSRRTVSTAKGGTKEVGEFGLHLNCPWRLIGPAAELLACDKSEPDVLAGLGSPPLLCSGILAQEDGTFELAFAGGERLQVEPGEPDWRLFQPSRDQPHFVVGPSGVHHQRPVLQQSGR